MGGNAGKDPFRRSRTHSYPRVRLLYHRGGTGRKTVYLTAERAGAEVFIGASKEDTFTLDDVFIQEDTAAGAQKKVEFELTAEGAWDCIMIFCCGNANGFPFTIDDFSEF